MAHFRTIVKRSKNRNIGGTRPIEVTNLLTSGRGDIQRSEIVKAKCHRRKWKTNNLVSPHSRNARHNSKLMLAFIGICKQTLLDVLTPPNHEERDRGKYIKIIVSISADNHILHLSCAKWRKWEKEKKLRLATVTVLLMSSHKTNYFRISPSDYL